MERGLRDAPDLTSGQGHVEAAKQRLRQSLSCDQSIVDYAVAQTNMRKKGNLSVHEKHRCS